MCVFLRSSRAMGDMFFSFTSISKLHLTLNSLLLLLSVQIILVLSPGSTMAATLVESIPGYPGKLPFRLETGYIGVGEEEEIQLFYYYVESERDPKIDPLVFWLTGGPGSSGLSPFILENGPLYLDYPAWRQSGLPTFKLNPYSWTKVASIIFIDAPVGTGFSYGTTSKAYYTGDIKTARHNYEFLRKWLQNEHSELQGNSLYVSGDSYGGILVPIVVQEVLNGNKAGNEPFMNIKGYSLGNPFTENPFTEKLSSPRFEYARRVSLLSDELYEATRESCHDNYESVDPSNAKCIKNLQAMSQDLDPLNFDHILESSCDSPIQPPRCRGDEGDYRFLPIWANDLNVREALNIREGTVDYWVRKNITIIENTYTKVVQSTFDYHQNFTKELLHVLIYSGDQDLVVPYVGTLAWITRLSLQIVSRWKPWFVGGQVAGYTTKYSNGHYNLTYATVKGAGHTAPEYKPRECFNMFTKWLSKQSL